MHPRRSITIPALLTLGVAFLAGTLALTPAQSRSQAAHGNSVMAASASDTTIAAPASQAAPATEASAAGKRRRALAMPYFSFAPGLRGGRGG